MTEISKTCAEECRVSETDLKVMENTTLSNITTENAKCYTLCFLQKFGVIVNDLIKFDKLEELIKMDCSPNDLPKISQRIDDCKLLKGPNIRETTILITECIYKNKFCEQKGSTKI